MRGNIIKATFIYTMVDYLIDLRDHSIKYFSFKRPKHNSFVFHRINHKASSWLYKPSTNIINCCHSNDKTISEGEFKISLVKQNIIMKQMSIAYLYNNLVPSVCLYVCMSVCMSVCHNVVST